MEAVKCGQDDMIEPLLRAGARLNMEDSKLATYMCELVVANDLTQLQRLIKAGADVNAGECWLVAHLGRSGHLGNP